MAVAVRRIPTALPWHHVRHMARRLSWGITDQAVCSLTNFLLSVFVARSLGAAQFGAFSLAYVTYGFAINASRGLSIEPLLVRFSTASLAAWRRATAGSTGTALLVGLATGTIALVAALLIGGTTGLAFAALGLMLPGLLLQDSWRYAFFALGRGHHALVNDTVWAAVQIPLLVYLKTSGHANVFWFTLAWGAGAFAGAVLGVVQARVMPSLGGALSWLVQHRDLGPRYLMENAGGNASDTVRSYSTSAILGVGALGYINAANVLMGPFKIIYFGISMITIPEAARTLRRAPRRLRPFCVAITGGLTLLALLWGVAIQIAMPLGLGHLMLGSLWRPATRSCCRRRFPSWPCAPEPGRGWACTRWEPRAAACGPPSSPRCRSWSSPSGEPSPWARSARSGARRSDRGSASCSPGGISGRRCASRAPSRSPGDAVTLGAVSGQASSGGCC